MEPCVREEASVRETEREGEDTQPSTAKEYTTHGLLSAFKEVAQLFDSATPHVEYLDDGSLGLQSFVSVIGSMMLNFTTCDFRCGLRKS